MVNVDKRAEQLRKASKIYRKKNQHTEWWKEKRSVCAKRRYKKHKLKILSKGKERSIKNPKGYWASNLKSNTGLTVQEYLLLLDSQKGVCAICENPPGNKRLAVDHNHITSKIRGLLCSNCNSGLGMLQDSVDRLEKAVKYLKERDT